MKYRKKPVVIDAAQISVLLHCAKSDFKNLPPWVAEAYKRAEIIFLPNSVTIATLEGNMHGEYGDWLICGVKGELYPCKPDIFEASYERVED